MKFSFSYKWLLAIFFLPFLASCEKDDSIQPRDAMNAEADVYNTMQQVLLEAMTSPDVREFIKSEASKAVTYDYEVVYGMVKDKRISNGGTLEEAFLSAEERLLSTGKLSTTVVANLAKTAPLLSINVPIHVLDWDTDNFIPPVIVDAEGQKYSGKVTAQFQNGNLIVIYQENLPNHPVINLAQNERMVYEKGKYSLDYGLIMYSVPNAQGPEGESKSSPPDDECVIINGEPVCDSGPVRPRTGGSGNGTPTSCDSDYNVNVIMDRLRLNNLGSYEFLGRPELRLRVIGGDGQFQATQGNGRIIVNYFTTPRRRWINNRWWNIHDNLFVWNQAHGEVVHFDWKEEDGGAFRSDQDTFSLVWNNNNYSITIPTFLKRRDEDLGSYPVNLNRCNRVFGSSGGIQFRLAF